MVVTIQLVQFRCNKGYFKFHLILTLQVFTSVQKF